MQPHEKPEWMAEHEESDLTNFKAITAALARIEGKLDPIYDNYQAASRLGKWFMALAVFGSVLLGIVLSFKSLLGR